MNEYKLNNSNPKTKTMIIYSVLGLSVVASGAFAWMGVSNQLTDIEKNGDKIKPQVEQPVENKKPDVPKAPVTQKLPESSQSQGAAVPPSTTTNNTKQPVAESKQSATLPAPSLIMPHIGEIIGEFSNGELVKSKTLNDWRTHNGVDIKAVINDEVKAVSNGKIKDVYSSPMWGTVVELELEDGAICSYSNLSEKTMVKKDQKVNVGDVIGTVGKTAQSEIGEDDHLHFEIVKDTLYINPLEYLKK